ncbi:SAVED domain-containing protein [Rhizobium sp. ZPR3]|uniref:SAVED domain-containing protein n=2 Tax=unclassified Rhizobium TaxID=2613769 RepID=A0AAU7SF45_9HYPH
MTDKQPAPTLTDSKGMGGVIAQDGFEYQIWDGLARLPAWLMNPAFEGMIFEGLEDLEVRFFAPLALHGSVIDRHQAKSGVLKPADIKEIVEGFLHYQKSYPDTARTHILVTPQIPATLAYMANDRDRVRKARPFYDPFVDLKAAFDAKFRSDVLAFYPDPLGGFVVDFVDFEERNIPDEKAARSLFDSAFHEAFPTLDLKVSQVRKVFDDLLALAKANHNIGSFLTRKILVQCIENAMGESLPLPPPALHVLSDRKESNSSMLELDAAAFSAGAGSTADWNEGLLKPLRRTATWFKQQGASRLTLQGSYRLSAGFALGWSFRAATGFDIDIVTRDGVWATDDRPEPGASYPQWDVSDPQVAADVLTVSIGILRDPYGDLVASGIPAEETQRFHLSVPVTSAKQMQALVGQVKARVAGLAAKQQLKQIRLYYAGPAQFAVALGHRWNSMPETVLHEFNAVTREYVATLTLS